jgi:hypothetical protein
LLVAAALMAAPSPAGAIINGVADNGAHPNVGTIIWRDAGGALFRSCSGTMISTTVFLTAAHCLVLDPAFPGEAPVGVSFDAVIADPPTSYLSGTAHAHPNFVWGNGQGYGATGPKSNDPFDVGVIVLDTPVSATPAHLATVGLLDTLQAKNGLKSTTFVTVGYGATDPAQPGAAHCCGPRGERRFAVETFRSLAKAMLDTNQNAATGNGGGCYGDSGGPHFLGTTDVIVAITSIGDIPCVSNARSYRVDTAVARAFLGGFVTLP